MNPQERHLELIDAQADGLAAREILEELRSGRVANALELLEQHLDTSILAMHTFSRDADALDQEQVTKSLRILREYRRCHPREMIALIDGAKDAARAREVQKRVQEILDGTL